MSWPCFGKAFVSSVILALLIIANQAASYEAKCMWQLLCFLNHEKKRIFVEIG